MKNFKMLLGTCQVLWRLRQHASWTRAQLEAHQAHALRHLRDYAYAHSPFYRRFHQGLFDRPLAELPVLTKTLVMENFDELVTNRAIALETVRTFAVAASQEDQRYLDHYRVLATSGSSGQPGFFLFNPTEWNTMVASFLRGQMVSGLALNLRQRYKVASIASALPWHISAQVGAAATTWWTPALRLPASAPLPNLVQQLNAWQPDILFAYASVARALAKEQAAGRLHIQPRKVFTSAELLTAETRRHIQFAWGAEPFNQYGATETASIAAEYAPCRHLHVFEDLLIIEVVDEHHRPVPAGTYGASLLVTTLFSRTQPLIRYELNDSVRLATTPCLSGLPFGVLESLQGRLEDRLLMPAQAGGRVVVDPLVFDRVMDVLPVSGWQIVQGAADGLLVLISGACETLVDAQLVENLRATLVAHGVQAPTIKVQRVAQIPKAASGKAPLIKAYRPGASRIHNGNWIIGN